MVKNGEAVPICPEQLGGLPTPRPPVEKNGKKVVTNNGGDFTAQFAEGAEEGFKIARLVNANEAILKSRSPSCGCGQIYDGTFSKRLTKGNGIFAQLLIDHGIGVKSEEDL
jgi:uncharacterized protein YbbK (DUF523 family)